MQMFFVYPAKIVTGETKLDYNVHTFGKFQFLEFVEKNVYFCQKTEKVKYTETKGYGANTYFLKINENQAVRFFSADDINHLHDKLSFMDPNQLESMYNDIVIKVQNLEETNNQLQQEARKKQEEIEEAKRQKELKRIQEEKEAQEKLILDMNQAEIDFVQGKMIMPDAFEYLCRKHGIKIAISTLGAFRKYFRMIGYDSARTTKQVSGIWKYAKELKNSIDTAQNA